MLPFNAMLYRRVGAVGAVIANGQSWIVSDGAIDAAPQARYTAQANGSSSYIGDSATISDWRTPTATGAGDAVWVEFTLSSGSTPNIGTLNTRQQLTSARDIGLTRLSAGTSSCVVLVKFYDAASGGNLLGSNTLTLTATRTNT